MQTSLQISQQKNSIRMGGGGGGAGSCLRSCRFSESDDRPSKEICQSFENRNEHARNAKDSCYFVCGDSKVANAFVLSHCYFTVCMLFCGSAKFEHCD